MFLSIYIKKFGNMTQINASVSVRCWNQSCTLKKKNWIVPLNHHTLFQLFEKSMNENIVIILVYLLGAMFKNKMVVNTILKK